MREWTEKEINDVIDLKGHNGEQLNVFDLYGVLFVGNCLDEPSWNPKKMKVEERSTWEVDRRFCRFSAHGIGFTVGEFDGCETEDEVSDRFDELLRQAVIERLL